MSGYGRGGIPNKKSLIARADMERLGINPIEMMKRVFDEAMRSYERSEPSEKGGDPGVGYLAIAGSMAEKLANYKHPKLSAVAVKDVGDEETRGANAMDGKKAREILFADPIRNVKTEEVLEMMKNPIEAPVLPKGENE